MRRPILIVYPCVYATSCSILIGGKSLVYAEIGIGDNCKRL